MAKNRELTVDDVLSEANSLRRSVAALKGVPEVTRRTLRYYVQKRLLPPAGTRGPGARYPESTIYRLLFIRLLQQKRLTDPSGRDRLPTFDDVKRALREVPDDTIRRVVLGREALDFRLSVTAEELESRRRAGEQIVHLSGAGPALLSEDEASAEAVRRWRRLRVARGVELRIRRRISAKQARVLRLMAKLLAEALSEAR